jgi:hypothetical protein
MISRSFAQNASEHDELCETDAFVRACVRARVCVCGQGLWGSSACECARVCVCVREVASRVHVWACCGRGGSGCVVRGWWAVSGRAAVGGFAASVCT